MLMFLLSTPSYSLKVFFLSFFPLKPFNMHSVIVPLPRVGFISLICAQGDLQEMIYARTGCDSEDRILINSCDMHDEGHMVVTEERLLEG